MNQIAHPALRLTIDVQYSLAPGETLEYVQNYLRHAVNTIIGDGFLSAHHNLDSEVHQYDAKIERIAGKEGAIA